VAQPFLAVRRFLYESQRTLRLCVISFPSAGFFSSVLFVPYVVNSGIGDYHTLDIYGDAESVFLLRGGIGMNRTCRRALALSSVTMVLLTALSAAPVSRAQNNPIRNSVSIVQLIATPEKYDGKVVKVMGFLRLEFEGDAIYLHEDDYRHGISKNGLMVVRNAKIDANADTLDLHYVLLEGTFDANNHGNMGLNSGTITNITFTGICPTRNTDHRSKSSF
jgi:hypothetical protein